MKYEFGHVDGLSSIFASRDDMLRSVFKPDVVKSLDKNSTIYVRCAPEDADIFGKQFVGGSTWVITHGLALGDEGSRSLLRDYNRTEVSSTIEIRPVTTIQEAITILDNRSAAGQHDWLIIN